MRKLTLIAVALLVLGCESDKCIKEIITDTKTQKVKEISQFIDCDPKIGIERTFYGNQDQIIKLQKHYLKEDSLISKVFYNNGNTKLLFTKVNGKLQGEYKEYYEKGSVKSLTNFKDGIKTGKSFLWKESGELIEKNN